NLLPCGSHAFGVLHWHKSHAFGMLRGPWGGNCEVCRHQHLFGNRGLTTRSRCRSVIIDSCPSPTSRPACSVGSYAPRRTSIYRSASVMSLLANLKLRPKLMVAMAPLIL